MDHKKTDYGNWVPLALMKRLAAIAGALLAGEVLLIVLDGPTALTLLVGGLLAAAVILWLYMLRCRVLFDFNRGGLMGQVHQYLTDHLPWDGRGTLLDIGCGTGLELASLYRRFPALQVTGIDLSETMLGQLRASYPDRDLRLIQADYTAWDLGEREYDGVLSFETLHHLLPEEKEKLYVYELAVD